VGSKELRSGGANGDQNCLMRYVRFRRPTRRSWRPNDKGGHGRAGFFDAGKMLLVQLQALAWTGRG
jgi:hypothetical protein